VQVDRLLEARAQSAANRRPALAFAIFGDQAIRAAAAYSSSSTSACSSAPAAIHRPSVQATRLSASFRPLFGTMLASLSTTLRRYASARRRSLSFDARETFADGDRCSSGRFGSAGGSGNVDGSSSGPSWRVALAVTPPL
ncbi:MAG: hypothetical protein M3069_32300, partial [Chloroflexota bacterium]|nr:hypothetical protein [Chloroflexota bacterium]